MTQILLFHALFITLSLSQREENHIKWKVPPDQLKLCPEGTTRVPIREDVAIQTERDLTCPSSSFRSEVFTNAPSFISSSYISLSQEMKKEPKNFCISTVTYIETGIMKLKRTIKDKKSVNIRKTCNGKRRR